MINNEIEAAILGHEETLVFVVRRYDRVTKADETKRLHQEDFCQALGIPPESKSGAGPELSQPSTCLCCQSYACTHGTSALAAEAGICWR